MVADEAEKLCLAQPQVGCEVTHHFGPGVYMRVCTIEAGVFVTSHCHKQAHTNIQLTGTVAMRDNDGPIYISKAPRLYVGQPGRKMGYFLEKTVWMNVFATNETDVEKLEDMFFDKSPAFRDAAAKVMAEESLRREADRLDFLLVLVEYGITPFQAREWSERTDDMHPEPVDLGTILIRESAIEGRGLFVQVRAAPGDVLAPARLNGLRTPVGRYANHSQTPNAMFVEKGGDAFLMAICPIAPYCSETVPGDEITVDYRQALSLAGRLR